MDWEYRPRIASLREGKQLTQLELAQQVGVTETTIANWEKGRSGVEWLDRLIRLCAALECTPEDLLSYIPRISEGDESFSAMVRLIEDSHQDSQLASSEEEDNISSQLIQEITENGGTFSQIVKLIEVGQQAQAKQLSMKAILSPMKSSARIKVRKSTPSKS
ncbi:helix-turn-helix transcriptional regulator [Phormidium sp. FACHB-1136]|nr:helix-turn-helix transcriptional regulator [Phormidium sp. FACHB-1136]